MDLARFRVALVPSKAARALLHAGDQMTAGVGNVLFRVLAWLVAHAQFDWVEVQFLGQFVHRAFQRHKSHGLAGRAHRRCNRNVEGHQTMPGQPIGPRVKRTSLESGVLVGLLAGQIAGEHIVADREDTALAIGAQADALNRVGAVRGDVKNLLPRQRDFYRSLERPRRDRCQDGVGIDPEFAAESAADERADQAYILHGDFQGCRDDLLTLVEHLVGGVQDQFVAVPHRKRGMRLHHRVTLQWGGIGHVNLHGGAGERSREIAHGAVGCRRVVWLWDARFIDVGTERVFPA